MTKNSQPLLALIAIGLLILGLLLWRFPYVWDSTDNLAYLIRGVIILGVLFPAIRHFGSGQAIRYGAAWAGIFLVLLIGYSYHEEVGKITERVKHNLIPFNATQNKDGSVSFMRTKDGHFQVEAYVNRVPIQFMVDTGASTIALTTSDAKKLGIDVESLSYNKPVYTANGMTFAASTRLAELKIGTITLHHVSASVCQNLDGLSLLGMNVLNQLKGVKIEGNRLTFEAPSSR